MIPYTSAERNDVLKSLDNRVEYYKVMDIQEVCKLAADASELTHQHPLGYIPSALVAYVIYKLVKDEAPERETYKDYIREGLKVIAWITR